MNEGNVADGLEGYLRNSFMLNRVVSENPPMFMMLDQKYGRKNVLKKYAEFGHFPDSIAVSKGDIVPKKYLEISEDERPTGYQNWNEWGAPAGSPGQSSWHPKYMEHEL